VEAATEGNRLQAGDLEIRPAEFTAIAGNRLLNLTALAQDLVRQDDEIDRLNRACFHRALAIGDDPDRREWAMHMMLVARCLERIGDNAVDVGEQCAFVVTGLFREFEDASHPELAPGLRGG